MYEACAPENHLRHRKQAHRRGTGRQSERQQRLHRARGRAQLCRACDQQHGRGARQQRCQRGGHYWAILASRIDVAALAGSISLETTRSSSCLTSRSSLTDASSSRRILNVAIASTSFIRLRRRRSHRVPCSSMKARCLASCSESSWVPSPLTASVLTIGTSHSW